MIGIILISHGNLAEGLLDAAKMITGEVEKIVCIGLQPEDDIDLLVDRIGGAANQVDDGDGVLLMVDLFGASPFNASGRLVLAEKGNLELITGMNLPMLVEILVAREGLSLEDASEMAINAGKSGISRLSDKISR